MLEGNRRAIVTLLRLSPRFFEIFLLHRIGELPRYDLLHSLCLRLLELINARTHMFLAHCSTFFLRFRASAESSHWEPRSDMIPECEWRIHALSVTIVLIPMASRISCNRAIATV